MACNDDDNGWDVQQGRTVQVWRSRGGARGAPPRFWQITNPISTCRGWGADYASQIFFPSDITEGRLAKRSLSSSLFFSREPSSLQLLLCDDASRQHHGPRPLLHSAANLFFFFAKHSSSRLQVILLAPWLLGIIKLPGLICQAFFWGFLLQNILKMCIF